MTTCWKTLLNSWKSYLNDAFSILIRSITTYIEKQLFTVSLKSFESFWAVSWSCTFFMKQFLAPKTDASPATLPQTYGQRDRKKSNYDFCLFVHSQSMEKSEFWCSAWQKGLRLFAFVCRRKIDLGWNFSHGLMEKSACNHFRTKSQ
jgi:hypothetical protein